MPQNSEVILAVIPGSTEKDRLVIAHRQTAGDSRIELRQQTWGEGIGWFTQHSLPLEPHQAAQLRATLGGKSPAYVPPAVSMTAENPRRPSLRIFAESA